jgi:hypothetical protein
MDTAREPAEVTPRQSIEGQIPASADQRQSCVVSEHRQARAQKRKSPNKPRSRPVPVPTSRVSLPAQLIGAKGIIAKP